MRTFRPLLMPVALATLAVACRDDSPTGLATNPAEPRVFTDAFIGADFQAFSGSKLDAVQPDTDVKYSGTTSLRVTIPAPGDATGGYAGGAFVSGIPRDLTGYNAVTFWARASRTATLNVAGLGNDNTGSSLYTAERNDIPLTTTWQKITIPIPDATKLASERGLFFFAEGAEDGTGYTLWLDEIRFEQLSTVTNRRAAVPTLTLNTEVGGTQQLRGLTVTHAVSGTDVTTSAMPGYFTFTSSNPAVATVSAAGVVSIAGTGNASVTATLGGAAATGTITVNGVAAPTAGPAAPTQDAADVISLFSGAYTNRTVDTWSAVWDVADVSDVTLGGNAVKRYANFEFAGIEFITAQIDASSMTHLHMDVYVTDATRFGVKLVDFGANGVFGGGDDTEHQVDLSATSTPAMTAGGWTRLEIPLSRFAGLTSRTRLSQLIISGSSAITYIDNVFFYRVEAPTAPVTAAPTPTYAAGDVISLFSDAYTNRTVDGWALYGPATVADVSVAGNAVKRYNGLGWTVIEFAAQKINATSMTHFRTDVWTPDDVTAAGAFRIKLVDFGADNAFGGGDDVEHEVAFSATTTPALSTGSWITLDIPLSQFTGLTTRANLAQLVISSASGLPTIFVDNILFHR